MLATVMICADLAQGQSTSPYTITAPGATAWTSPANVYSVQVAVWGGGGGGGGVGTNYAGAGGGAGGSFVSNSVTVTPNKTYYLTVGAGGLGGMGATNGAGAPQRGANGGTGGSSYFGTSSLYATSGALILAVGGSGGNLNNTLGTSNRYTGSAGGLATTNGNVAGSGASVNRAGTSGTNAAPSGAKQSGGGGNGAGPSGSAGGGNGAPEVTSAGNGTTGSAPGGGGSGGLQVTSAKNGSGGAGGTGQLVLTWIADTAPTLTASAASSVTASTATLNGTVTSAGGTDGGSTITDRGFVYGTSASLTIHSNKTAVAGTTGPYSLSLSGLTGGTTYYFAAYASNSAGLTLSPELSFATMLTPPPVLTAANNATVDAPFNITFADSSSWRAAVTGITVGGFTLSSAAYVVAAGKITFTPANDGMDSLIRTPGPKTIAVSATTYSSETVTQTLGAGVAAKLVLTTPPTAPPNNGGLLATQPVVVIQDQYGNPIVSGATITAAPVQTTWSLGGTTNTTASLGTAAFAGLTATSTANLTGATIQFTSGNLSPAISTPGFNIPMFTVGNLAVEQLATNATSSAISILELSPSLPNQSSPINSIAIPSTGSNALRQTSAASSGRLATSSDGTLLAFTGYLDSTGVADETTITHRGVGTLDVNDQYTLQTTYNNATGAGDQTRGAITVDNQTWYIGDKAGIYTNGTSLPANATNVRPLKSFGGTLYVLSQNAPAAVSTLSSAGLTLTSLPGVPANSAALDFYLFSSGNNGTNCDILYVHNGTTVNKYSWVNGSWVTNGPGTRLGLASGYAADGLCAAANGSGGAYLYITTGTSNTVVRITDSAGWNAAASFGSPTTLYTGAAGYLKGIAFAPAKPATVIVTVGTYIYNGAAQGPTNVTLTTTNPDTGAVTFSYAGTANDGGTYAASATPPTLAGSYSVIATVAADANHSSASSIPTPFTIARANSRVTLGSGTNFTYNGAAQGPSFTVSGSSASLSYSYSGSGSTTYAGTTAPTAAGAYIVLATVAQDNNYNSASSSATAFTINPLPVLLTGSRVYDGTATAAAGILSVANNLDGGNLTLSGSGTLASPDGGQETLVSFHNLTLGGSAAGDYTFISAGGWVRINPSAASSFTLNTTSNTPASFNTSLLTRAASDAGVTLSVTGVSAASTAGGTVSLSGSTLTYAPAATYVGPDSFTYTLSDNVGGNTTGTVSVMVNAISASSGLARQWVADDYVSGHSWVDRINGTVAVTDGPPAPVAVTNAFGIHNGVMRNTGATGNGGFLIPGGNPPTGWTNYTITVVFQAAAAGPTNSVYALDQIMFGYHISNPDQPDWGLSWGGSGTLSGQGVSAGIDTTEGYSGLQSGPLPLALNATHAAVFQINGSNGTETLFVDGLLMGQDVGTPILAPKNSMGTGAIPLLSTSDSDITSAFTGPIAEVRVYTNATIPGTALSAYLQNFYAPIPQITLAASPAVADVGGTVHLQVFIPVSQSAPFAVTLNSDNPGVVAGTNFVFAAGTTSTNIPLVVLAAGTARITASDMGIPDSAPLVLSGLPAGAVLPVAWFKADAIAGVTNGQPLNSWADVSGNGDNASQAIFSQEPTYVTNGMNGLPLVRFNSANSTSLAFARPVQDDFSLLGVFQSTQGLNSGTLYSQGAGLISGAVADATNDLGICLFANGSIAAGTGNPDVAVDSAAGYNDGNPHIFTFTRTGATGLLSLYVDGALAGTATGGTQSLTSSSVLVLGAQPTLANYLSGDLAEVQIYNTALSGANQQNAEGPLFQKYHLSPSAPTNLYLQMQNGQMVLNWLPSSVAIAYEILRATTAGGPYTIIATNLTTTFTDTTVSPTNFYYYEVAAISGTGQLSAQSAAVSTASIPSRHEPLGPSSRATPIAISEIMWKPAPRTDGKNLEFLEIYNSNPWFEDISRYTLTCADMNYTFPVGTTIACNSFLVIAAAPADMESVYGLTHVQGPYTGSLKHSETLELLDEQTNVLLTVPYTDVYPWPVATDGTGHSLILSNPSYGEGDPRAWDISSFAGGSPGAADVYPASGFGKVVINEILPHSENPAVPQFIELYNHSTNSVDISGCSLTDDPTTNKLVIPSGTVIGPAGFVSFTQSQFGFTLNGAGERLYFISANGSQILDAVQFGAQADGVSYGRWPDGANDFYAFTTNTPGTNNSAILIGDIVINELMYDPISGNDADQYLELYNQGTNPVNLAGWELTSGVSFTFPSVTMAPNGYLVVAENLTNLFAKYPNLNSGNTVGNYSGKLSHSGELVTLSRPETLYVTNTIYVAEDEVSYGTGGRWGEWSAGGGSSLELIDPHANHRLAANWADSNDTAKSVWTNVTCTGVLDNGANYDPCIDYAQMGILDEGECLVDNLEVLDTNGVNYVSNGTFESGNLNNWSLQGALVDSSLENSGFNSAYSLHMRCSDKLWTGDNSCEVALNANSLAPGQTVTLSYAARWLHGLPEPLLRLNGNWLEATAVLPVPNNLGSPGTPNSTYITNAGPAIYNVTHAPAVPAANQPVVVTANVSDPDGVQNLTLYYRLDPATNYTSVTMTDDGTGGDVVPGDGIFSATIQGQAANYIVAFYLSATDSLGATTRFPAIRANDNEPVRECVVMFGDGNPSLSFGVYHLWITQTNLNRWWSLGNLSRDWKNDCTFVNNNRVIYNMDGRFAGSPYHQSYDTPNGDLCNYEWKLKADDMFLGTTDFKKIHQPGALAGSDASLQRSALAFTFHRALGVPWLYKRFVAVYVNGNLRGGSLMEDSQVPDADVVNEHFPNDSHGYLYKMQPWFEFEPTLEANRSINFATESWCNLMPYTTTGGVDKVPRYRWDYEIRRTPDTYSNFTNVFSLVEAASAYGTPNYVTNLENLANMENWMRVFAAGHAAGDGDFYGAENGQNLYSYFGTLGTKCTLLMWDLETVFGNNGSWGPGQDLFFVNPEDPNTQNIYNCPVFLRMYWRALQDLVNGPLNVTNSGPLLEARYHAFTANGFNVEDPAVNLEPWLSQAQSSIASQLAEVNAASFTANPSVTVSNDVAYVTGEAPVNVASIWINGMTYPLNWTSLTSWSIALPLANITNVLSVVGVDPNGVPVGGESTNVSITYNLPSLTFLDYSQQNMVYTQDFDSLPNPGTNSVNADNPVTLNGLIYALANPFNFTYPATPGGNIGGLGISSLLGWYGSGLFASKFGATAGDQTTGGVISFGPTNSANRALGLLATSSTGATAFGVGFTNGTSVNLSQINLHFTGEVWRQSDRPKTLQFYYFVDPTAAAVFPTNVTAFLPALNVNFPTVPADSGGVAVDGTAPLNQTNLSLSNQIITNWPPGAALWLVWQMTDATGKAQGLAIDNLSFSANIAPPPLNLLTVDVSGTNIFLNWLGVAGQSYQLEYKNDLTAPAWTPLGSRVTGTGGVVTVPINFGASLQRYFRLQLVN